MAASMSMLDSFTEMFDKQDQTDVYFKLMSDTNDLDSASELVGAHKFILGAASPVFRKMFSQTWSSNGKPIEIKVANASLFKKFIGVIYQNRLSADTKENKTVVALYELAHMYQTSDLLDLLSSHMIRNCNAENVVLFANVAWTQEDFQLKKTCEKVFAKDTMKALKSPDFLSAKPVVINAFYTLDAMNVDSEDIFVNKLDEYIGKHQENIPDILKVLKPAIENLRISLITDSAINRLTVSKNLLLQLKGELAEQSKNGFFVKKFPRKKITVLSQLPIEMLEVLYKKFTDEKCYNNTNNCTFANSRALRDSTKSTMHHNTLCGIYNNYAHTNLSKYSDENVKRILDVFKKDAIYKGDTSEFKVFLNYEEYLSQ